MKCTSWRMLMAHIMLSKIIGELSFGEDNWTDLVSQTDTATWME